MLRDRFNRAKGDRTYDELRRETGLGIRTLTRLARGEEPMSPDRCKRGPTIETVERVARAVGVSPGWLAFGEGEP